MEIEPAINKIKEIIKQAPKLEKQVSNITVGFPFYDGEEIGGVLRALMNGRISQGPYVQQFERDFADYIGRKHAIGVNSGSSANLLSLQSLIDNGKLKPGDEVLLPATTFITVATPIIQVGLVPVFIDVERNSMNIDPNEIKKGISDKTKAIMVVHTLGLPADMDKICDIAKKDNLVIIEDSCEAHGASIGNKKTGGFGDIATFSFFVAHNMTTGEGGMILTDDDEIADTVRSLRAFGRITQPNTQEERLNYDDGRLKHYDTRYVFTKIGYNLRMTDITAAFGIEQLKRLDNMNKRRIEIIKELNQGLKTYSDYIELQEVGENVFHSYYGYPILVKKNAPFSRHELVAFLESKNIETRPIFAGCLPDQPALSSKNYKEIGELKVARFIRDNGLFIGCHPMIATEGVKYVVRAFRDFFNNFKSRARLI